MVFGLILFLLIVFTAFGLALLTAAFFRLCLFLPPSRTVTLMPVSDSGNDMELAVRFFCRYGSGEQFLVFIDGGLDAEGRRCAELLERNDPNVFLCKEEELYTLMKRLCYAEQK